jgi:hypothetical protein
MPICSAKDDIDMRIYLISHKIFISTVEDELDKMEDK